MLEARELWIDTKKKKVLQVWTDTRLSKKKNDRILEFWVELLKGAVSNVFPLLYVAMADTSVVLDLHWHNSSVDASFWLLMPL